MVKCLTSADDTPARLAGRGVEAAKNCFSHWQFAPNQLKLSRMAFPVPSNESARLAALESYRILDTAPEVVFEDIVAIAAHIAEAPMAAISLVDVDRQWFKAQIGLAVTATPRDQAFCAHTILQPEVMVVEDARADHRFAENPLVTGEPGIRFYAGAPLLTPTGEGLGSICIIDRHPRKLSPVQAELLQRLSRIVMQQLELRRVATELADSSAKLKVLPRLVAICSSCQKIRRSPGEWLAFGEYLRAESHTKVAYGLCPACSAQPAA